MHLIDVLEKFSFLFPIVIAVIIVPIGFLVKHFFFYKKEAKINPRVHISPLKKRDRLYAEIYNTGDEDISNLTIVIYWKQKGSSEKRKLNNFFNENESPILESGHYCKFIRKEEKKVIDGLPMYSDDGKIKFIISGLGVKSNKKFSNSFFINNAKDNEH